jgi:dGTPase
LGTKEIDNFSLREIREMMERETLSPLAAFSTKSRGRQRDEAPCPVRTCYQRDRDRVLYSKAFRRLMHKTQVFIAPEGDHFRTRLTHTIEVSQIARTIARALRLNEDLTEAIALGHDLGHAPFGHAGEHALDLLMKKFTGDSFHHSHQSLRVVDLLEGRGGLNLTFEVRNGILAHTKGKGDIQGRGVFAEPETLEAEVVRISDRLAYINHDIDDATRAGIITPGDIPADLRKMFGENIADRINTMILDIVRSSWDRPGIATSPELAGGLNRLKDFMFSRVYTNSPAKKEEFKASYLITQLFEHFMENPQYIPQEIIEWGSPGPEAPGIDDARTRARAVCDFIAGMSDRYAVEIHKHLFVPGSWKIELGKGEDKR